MKVNRFHFHRYLPTYSWENTKLLNKSPTNPAFVVWTHRRNRLEKSLNHPNKMHQKIRFTMKTQNNQLSFLDVLVKKRADGSPGHSVYRKATDIDRNLNVNSQQHLAQLQPDVKTLTSRSQKLAEADHQKEEMNKLQTALLDNAFSITRT